MSTDVVGTLPARLAFTLGAAAREASGAHCPKLAFALGGLGDVLADRWLELRPSDGRALRHALQGFEAIFVDLELDAARADLVELRRALERAHLAAAELAAALEPAPDPPGTIPLRKRAGVP